jgi:stearoyl-CoA desaturase (delta-9 desaturase)
MEMTRRLPRPPHVQGQILWAYAIPIVVIHTLALLAFWPWLFEWSSVVVMLIGVHVFGQGINIGYHRLLAHRSFRTPKWVEHAFVLLALCSLEDTPSRWVANHRYHHKHSDDEPDPHSPLVSFLWSHIGWLMFKNNDMHSMSAFQKYASDLLRDPFYFKLEKRPTLAFWAYLAHAGLFFLVGLLIGALTAPAGTSAWWAGYQYGLSLLVWGVIVRTVVVWHITWSVNSLTHLFGYRSYDSDEHSTNNWLVAILSVGEGWHNNHHHDPASASNQHRWWELDLSFYEIKLLEKLGLASKVLPPRHKRRGRSTAANESPPPTVQAE